MNMKPLLFTMTFLFSVSGHSLFFEDDYEKRIKSSKLFRKANKAMLLGDLYSACKFYREGNQKIYEIKSESLIDKSSLKERNSIFGEKCKGY